MWAGKFSPYSKSNSSCPLFSTGQAMVKPSFLASPVGFPELFVHQDRRILLRHPAGDGRLETVVDYPFCPSDLRRLFRGQCSLPAEHTRFEKAAVIERQDISGRSNPRILMKSPLVAVATNEIVRGTIFHGSAPSRGSLQRLTLILNCLQQVLPGVIKDLVHVLQIGAKFRDINSDAAGSRALWLHTWMILLFGIAIYMIQPRHELTYSQ